MVSYKHMQNLAELPLGSTWVTARITDKEKFVVKLGDGLLYQAGDNLQQQKEQLADMCNILIYKIRLSPTGKKVCFV